MSWSPHLKVKTCHDMPLLDLYASTVKMKVDWHVIRIQTFSSYQVFTVCVCRGAGNLECRRACDCCKKKPIQCYPPVYLNWNGNLKMVSKDHHCHLHMNHVEYSGVGLFMAGVGLMVEIWDDKEPQSD